MDHFSWCSQANGGGKGKHAAFILMAGRQKPRSNPEGRLAAALGERLFWIAAPASYASLQRRLQSFITNAITELMAEGAAMLLAIAKGCQATVLPRRKEYGLTKPLSQRVLPLPASCQQRGWP